MGGLSALWWGRDCVCACVVDGASALGGNAQDAGAVSASGMGVCGHLRDMGGVVRTFWDCGGLEEMWLRGA